MPVNFKFIFIMSVLSVFILSVLVPVSFSTVSKAMSVYQVFVHIVSQLFVL